MPIIHILDESTINQIAAGEVVERPSAVVKELIENAMDAGATAITAEIKEGGLSLIRITDNGAGIAKEDISMAFLRHATSKIKTAEDLLSVTSLGFRGEALSSIASVAQVEMITKTPTALNGFRYLIEGGEEKSLEEIGCPSGTTILVRNLFYNTPARRKFLKSAMTEAGYISDLMERLMVSHPNVSFKYIVNNQVKLQSSGNNSTKDILYQVYGRDITKELLPLEVTQESVSIKGFIGKPIITRGNRNFENYFINGRYIKSSVITRAVEEAYKPFLMQHKYPFTSIYFEIDPAQIDVNVHPQKLEIRLKNSEELYQLIYHAIKDTLSGKEMIPKVTLTKEETVKPQIVSIPEPFEQNRRNQFLKQQSTTASSDQAPNPIHPNRAVSNHSSTPGASLEALRILSEAIKPSGEATKLETTKPDTQNLSTDKASRITTDEHAVIREEIHNSSTVNDEFSVSRVSEPEHNYFVEVKEIQLLKESNSTIVDQTSESNISHPSDQRTEESATTPSIVTGEQLGLFPSSGQSKEDTPFLSVKALEEHRIIGQLFSTYWMVEYKKELYIIDQHAAHEKVLYERIVAAAASKTSSSQQLLPPMVLSLTLREQEVLSKREALLQSLGYEIEHFGGNEYSIRAVPADLYGLSEKELFLEFIDDMVEDISGGAPNANSILERVASLSCKAAVKANHTFSYEEAAALIKELLTLDNPYHCPHGRPVIVSMSQYELERKFKRIV